MKRRIRRRFLLSVRKGRLYCSVEYCRCSDCEDIILKTLLLYFKLEQVDRGLFIMKQWITIEKAMGILQSNFSELGCQTQSDDYGQKLKLKIGPSYIREIDRKQFSDIPRLEGIISIIKGDLNEN